MFDKTCWSELLQLAVSRGASDIHLAAEAPIFCRFHGALQSVNMPQPSAKDVETILYSFLDERQIACYEKDGEVDFALTCEGQRLRGNAFRQVHGAAMAFRLIPSDIPSFEALGVPQVLHTLLHATHGLILVSGPTGAGKTTTLASFLSTMNHTQSRRIITLEDPIEYLHASDHCLISQRAYGTDFSSFAGALRNSLRDDPDVILVGEMRDADTVQTALSAAETGHLVLSSLHTQSAAEAVFRLESFFHAEQQGQIRAQLSIVLQAMLSQQLIPGATGGRVCAAEVLTATPAVRNLIRQGKVGQLVSCMMAGGEHGMQTMTQSVERLSAAGKISAETAARYLAR